MLLWATAVYPMICSVTHVVLPALFSGRKHAIFRNPDANDFVADDATNRYPTITRFFAHSDSCLYLKYSRHVPALTFFIQLVLTGLR